MTHFVEELQEDARAAIAAMRAAALHARATHARAELMRHMLTTAEKVTHLHRDEAVSTVVGEWMAAWHLPADAYPELAAEMRAFTVAFCAYAESRSEAADADLRSAAAALDAALERAGTSIADQMAWRSECAHGWWESVVPTPADLPGRAERPAVPKPMPGRPFWDAGAAPHCGGG
jgi:hypothetical protein